MHPITRFAAATAIAMSLTTAVAAPAAVAKDGDVVRSGRCSGSSDAELKLSDEDGRLEIEFEVDQNRTGQQWRVVLRHDGDRVLRTRATTAGRSGSFEVRTVVADTPGTDVVRARARNRQTGEVCRAVARW